jgi:hypothetical protein
MVQSYGFNQDLDDATFVDKLKRDASELMVLVKAEVLDELKVQLEVCIAEDLLYCSAFSRSVAFTAEMSEWFMSLGVLQDEVHSMAIKVFGQLVCLNADELVMFLDEENKREHALDMVIPLGWHILVCDVIRFCVTDGDLAKLQEAILVR